MSAFEQVVLAVALVIAIGGGWSVVWWLRAFPTLPTEIIRDYWQPVRFRNTAQSLTCVRGYAVSSSVAPVFSPGAVWPVANPADVQMWMPYLVPYLDEVLPDV